MRMAPLCLGLLLCGAPARAAAKPSGGDPDSTLGASSLAEGLRLFKARRFGEAARRLEAARRRQPSLDVELLLGICRYRLGELGAAEAALRAAAAAPDGEVATSARLFLALVLREQGGLDGARAELGRIADSRGGLGASARGLLQGLAPRRLQASFVLSAEFDGNVALTPVATWRDAGGGEGDGDLLAIASLSARPLPQLGLGLGTSLAYRQQLQPRFQGYNLLLSNSWLGYSYLGDVHRLRASASFGYALLGASSLYLEGEWRASYRVRLGARAGQLGLLASYLGRYRSYQPEDYGPFSGHSHTAQLELAYGLSPSPISAGLGYQVLREALLPGEPGDDYRATAHGPTLRVASRPHRRLELLFTGSMLARAFDAMPASGGLRRDVALAGDLSATFDVNRWLDAFAGVTLLYNDSNDSAFTFAKPIAYVGASVRVAGL